MYPAARVRWTWKALLEESKKMSQSRLFFHPLEQPLLRRPLDKRYYGTVAKQLNAPGASECIWCFGNEAVIEAHKNGEYIPAVGFTGTQQISNEGFRVTSLLAQVASALGFCVVTGHAYGVDMAAMTGALSWRDVSEAVGDRLVESPIRQIVALPSGIKSRAPRYSFIESGLLEGNGLYLSLLDDERAIQYSVLSPRDRLIVDMSDVLIVTEAGVRGSMDTINWAIEQGKKVLAVDGGDGGRDPVKRGYRWYRNPEKTSYGILRELCESEPDLKTLERLLETHFAAQVSNYDFSCAHPHLRCRDVCGNGCSNRPGYRTCPELARHLLETVNRNGCYNSPSIELVRLKEIEPPHEYDSLNVWRKAERIAFHLRRLLTPSSRRSEISESRGNVTAETVRPFVSSNTSPLSPQRRRLDRSKRRDCLPSGE